MRQQIITDLKAIGVQATFGIWGKPRYICHYWNDTTLYLIEKLGKVSRKEWNEPVLPRQTVGGIKRTVRPSVTKL